MDIQKFVPARTVKFYRIMPQIKTFEKGILLKNKIDLYFSTEENIVETGETDENEQLNNYIVKNSHLLFVEAAQFRADDNNIYVRAHLLSRDNIIWVNIIKIPNKLWSFMIRQEQKNMIKEKLLQMFEKIQ